MLSLKGEQTQRSRLLKAGIYHIGVYDVHLVQLVFLELLQHLLCDLTGSVKRGILGGVEKLSVNVALLVVLDTALEVHSSHLSHDKEVAVVDICGLFQLLLSIFKYIVVIASAESLVARDDDIALLTLILGDILTPVEVLLTGMGSMLENALDS